MNLVEILSEQVQLRPNSPAIIETRRGVDHVTSFAELDERSRRIAALLGKEGLRPTDPVLIFHPMSAELYSVLLGVFRLGAVAMLLDPSAGLRHIERCCELQAPRALIANPKAHALRLVSRELRCIPLKFSIGPGLPGTVSLRRSKSFSPFVQCESCPPEAPALLTFTSGSTGLPKAAVRTHGFLIAQHHVLERHLKLVPGEVDLTTLPIFLLANLASGVTSVIPNADLRKPGFIEAAPVLRQIQSRRVTRATASPAFFERLLEASDVVPEALTAVRKIYTGGAPVFPKLLDRLDCATAEAEIEAVYGSTEAEPIAHVERRRISPEDRAAMRQGNGLLAGKVIPEITLRIIRDQWGTPLGSMGNEQFAAQCLPNGEVGEIVVSGDHVMKGYLGGRGDDETKFSVEGEIWHRTGDAGKLDSSGRLWLLGRCSAKVDDSLGRLYPFAVECVAQEHPGVSRAAFMQHRGERCLVIQRDPQFNDGAEQSLRETVRRAGVERLLAVKRLPVDRRHNAKVDYPALGRLLERLDK
jgi:acyl-CoA synthetase (AMP-forming)/AMP-acid ligase II